MTQKLKSFFERNNYKITAVNTLLIITGITMGILQRRDIERKADFSLNNQNIMLKAGGGFATIGSHVENTGGTYKKAVYQ